MQNPCSKWRGLAELQKRNLSERNSTGRNELVQLKSDLDGTKHETPRTFPRSGKDTQGLCS